jgi:hypothetical protein
LTRSTNYEDVGIIDDRKLKYIKVEYSPISEVIKGNIQEHSRAHNSAISPILLENKVGLDLTRMDACTPRVLCEIHVTDNDVLLNIQNLFRTKTVN